jgi:hypothetical protein
MSVGVVGENCNSKSEPIFDFRYALTTIGGKLKSIIS